MLSFFRSRFSSREALWNEVWHLFKFGVVGVTSLGLNVALYALFSRVLFFSAPRTPVFVLAVIFSAIYNFLLHRAWTFQSRTLNAAMAGRYVIVLLAGMGLSTGLFYLGHEVLGFSDLLVPIASSFIVAGMTYVTHRWFTFHPKHG